MVIYSWGPNSDLIAQHFQRDKKTGVWGNWHCSDYHQKFDHFKIWQQSMHSEKFAEIDTDCREFLRRIVAYC